MRLAVLKLRDVLLRFVMDRRGATAIEYGVLATMIGIALIGMMSLGGVADSQNQLYDSISDNLKTAPAD